ncbi:MAG TPA: CHAT domain-containing tetratricopeptide repeat protein [Thermoanaerobaculia bacterium]|nr:CHAT domain-containing tetratricopeptide repeat protein [Thermoanaerobaculia bacterium]
MSCFSRRFLVCGLALAEICGARVSASPEPSPAPTAVFELSPGLGDRREIAGGATHLLRFRAPAGSFVVVEVEQDRRDVELTVVEPSGRRQAPVDSPTGDTGFERAIFLARETGLYGVLVKAAAGPPRPGGYRPFLTLRPASPNDLKEAEAEEAFYTAKAQARSGRKADAAAGYRTAAGLFAFLALARRERDAWAGLGDLARQSMDWKAAGEAYAKALALDQSLADLRQEALHAGELGKCAERFGDLAPAEADDRQTIELWQKLGEPKNEATAWVNLGHVTEERGEPWVALEQFDRALALSADPTLRAWALSGRGVAFASLGQFRTALQEFRAALALSRDALLRAPILAEMGNAYLKAGTEPLALARLEEGLRLSRKAGDRYTEAMIANSMGVAHFRRHEYSQALAAYQEALASFESLGQQRGVAAALINIGWLEAALGRPERALQAYRRAEPIAKKLDHGAAEAALHLGLAWTERRNPRAARAEVEEGIVIVEALQGEAAQRDLEDSFLATKQDFYSLLIELLMEEHRIDPLAGHDAEAFAVHERAQARSLLDLFARRSGAVPLNVAQVERQVLDQGAILLDYHLGQEHSYLWVVTQKAMASFELPGRERMESAVREFFTLLAAGDHRAQRDAARHAGIKLSQLLLGPVASRLGTAPLWIVPDGILSYVPFAALPDLNSTAQDLAASAAAWPEPLALRHEISEIPSASVLAAQRSARREEKAPTGFLALLADPVTDPKDPRLPKGAQPAPPELSSFPRLQYASREAAAIRGLATGSPVLDLEGFDVNRARVLSGELSQFRYLHFVTHGMFDLAHADPSGLLLSFWDRTGRRQEGILGSRDIQGLHLPAELVVLSACETARGREIAGEGLMGFTQRFFAASAARVIVSLWTVADSSTDVLMERLYRGLFKEGLSPAEALRQAQISMWREPRYRSPYHWAGFIHQGEPH